MIKIEFFLLLLGVLTCSDSLSSKKPHDGLLLDYTNIDEYIDHVDPPIATLIKDKMVTIEVGETFSIPQNNEYLKQTIKNKGTASIDPSTKGIVGYMGGLPFSEEPDITDAFAGIKIAWNMRYAYGGDSSVVDPFVWDYVNMKTAKIERTLSFVGKTLRYKYRLEIPPVFELPNNPADIFSAIYLLAKKPYDLRNTQLLVHRLEDDTARERSWLYLSVHRRVRRLPTGQSTDSFLGSDIMIEDFLGYNGRIMDMKWKYLATKELLVPIYKHNNTLLDKTEVDSDGFSFGTFHGQGNCFPNVPWQIKKVYEVEAIPTWEQHPLSKRIFYIDAETFIPVSGRYYDRAGKIWRTAIAGFSHPDFHLKHNKGSGVAIPSLISMIDVQAMHCTTLKMKTKVNVLGLKQKDFSVQALRTRGK